MASEGSPNRYEVLDPEPVRSTVPHLTSFKPLSPHEEDLPPLRSAYSSIINLFRFKGSDPVVHKGEPQVQVEGSMDSHFTPRRESQTDSWHDPRQESSSDTRQGTREHRSRTVRSSGQPLQDPSQRKEEGPIDPRSAVQLRSLGTVVKRLKEIMDGKSQDTDLKQYWMPDSQCKECYDCGEKFTTFRRRHHCRLCGQIFCSRCCNQEISGKFMGYTGDLRVCNYCNKVAMSYTASADGSSLGEDLSVLADQACGGNGTGAAGGSITAALEQSHSEPRTPIGSRKPSRVGFLEEQVTWGSRLVQEPQSSARATLSRLSSVPEEITLSPSHKSAASPQVGRSYKLDMTDEERKLLLDSVQLKELWRRVCHSSTGMEFRDHRYRLRNHPNTIVGKELIDWLTLNGHVSTREQGLGIGQALVDGHWLDCVTHLDQIFRDEYALYRPLKKMVSSEPASPDTASLDSVEGPSEPTWFKDIKYEDSDSEGSPGNERINSLLKGRSSPEKRASVSSFHSVASTDSAASVSLSSDLDNVNFHVKRHSSQPHVPPYYTEQRAHVLAGQQSQDEHQSIHISDDFIRESLYTRGVEKPNKDLLLTPLGWHHSALENLREENGERPAMEMLLSASHTHATAVLQQLLCMQCLPLAWCDGVLPIVDQAVRCVRPDVKNDDDDMDIRQYVHIKKIPGGKKFDSVVLNGYVFSKNVVHKKMNSCIRNPKILLLTCSIEYLYREETKFSSICPIVLQEREFLKNFIARIVDMKPHLMLVEKTVSRIAQDMLLENGIALVTNVKRKVMEMVSRMTQGDLVHSIDQLVTKPRLGSCHKFYVKAFQLPNGKSKTLMFFEGCAQHLGCTVLLRGSGAYELARVKEIILFMVYMVYHSRLEISFLMDEFAWPPSLSRAESLHSIGSEVGNKMRAIAHMEDPASKSSDGLRSSITDQAHDSLDDAQEADNLSVGTLTSGDLNSNLSADGVIEDDPTGHFRPDCLDCTKVLVGEHSITNVKNDGSESLTLNDSPFGLDMVNALETAIHEGQKVKTDVEVHVPAMLAVHSKEDHAITKASGIYYGSRDAMKSLSLENEDASKPTLSKGAADMADGSSISRLTKTTYAQPFPDHSDPLRARCEAAVKTRMDDESQFHDPLRYDMGHSACSEEESHEERLRKITRTFVTEMRDVILSVSPYMTFPEPFVLTDAGSRSPCRCYFSDEIFWSALCHKEAKDMEDRRKKQLLRDMTTAHLVPNGAVSSQRPFVVVEMPNHKLLSAKLTEPLAKNMELARLLADYRAQGGSLRLQSRHILRPGTDWNDQDHDPEQVCRERESSWASLDCAEESKQQDPWQRKIDSLNPLHHQKLCVLFSSFSLYSSNAPNPCVSPWLVTMEFYGKNDITLGLFLERYCFRPSYNCPSMYCDTPMVQHARQFVHGNGCVQILLKELQSPVPGYQHSILTWSWCCLCQQATPVVPLSADSWAMSFAKYLELRFYGQRYTRRASAEPCGHSIHQDYHQYFSHNQMVASFSHSSIRLRLICLPPLVVCIRPHHLPLATRLADLKDFTTHVQQVYQAVDERLSSLKTETFNKSREEKVEDMFAQKEMEESEFKEWLEKIQARLLTSAGDASHQPRLFSDVLIGQKQKLCEMVHAWNNRLQDMFHQEKGKKRQTVPPSPGRHRHSDDRSSAHDTSPRVVSTSNDKEEQGSSLGPPGTSATHLQPPSPYEAPTYNTEPEQSQEDVVDGFFGTSQEAQFKEKSTMKAIIATLLPGISYNPIPLPFEPDDHYVFEFERVPIVVCEKEPSTIIAFALSCKEHKAALEEIVRVLGRTGSEKSTGSVGGVEKKEKVVSPGKSPETILSSGGRSSEPETGRKISAGGMLSFFRGTVTKPPVEAGERKKAETLRGAESVQCTVGQGSKDVPDAQGQDEPDGSDKQKKQSVHPHIEIQFSDSSCRFYCRVYYGEEFRKLREVILSSSEEDFIHSLSHCMPWQARGGKSGSAFYETQDERFILKQMSRLEVQSFLEFAPHYFHYITNAVTQKRPTALAKILGVYRIGFKNSQTNTEKKQDLLVMENLFYGRKMTQVFDLKGSLRNRNVKAELSKEGPCELVLLDENLLRVVRDDPLYVRPHCKAALTAAILRDAHFLSSHLIIDYSLLVGWEEGTGQLVLGIIDYIRTFTWDKKLEMVVKSAGILGGQGKMPTVVSPELYRARFCEAMDKYFLKVPDHWTGLGLGIDY
ncbi:1-phosphatidylinositol 3-phosphate 5-kinase isoform X1 [Lampetra fluviatilis]